MPALNKILKKAQNALKSRRVTDQGVYFDEVVPPRSSEQSNHLFNGEEPYLELDHATRDASTRSKELSLSSFDVLRHSLDELTAVARGADVEIDPLSTPSTSSEPEARLISNRRRRQGSIMDKADASYRASYEWNTGGITLVSVDGTIGDPDDPEGFIPNYSDGVNSVSDYLMHSSTASPGPTSGADESHEAVPTSDDNLAQTLSKLEGGFAKGNKSRKPRPDPSSHALPEAPQSSEPSGSYVASRSGSTSPPVPQSPTSSSSRSHSSRSSRWKLSRSSGWNKDKDPAVSASVDPGSDYDYSLPPSPGISNSSRSQRPSRGSAATSLAVTIPDPRISISFDQEHSIITALLSDNIEPRN